MMVVYDFVEQVQRPRYHTIQEDPMYETYTPTNIINNHRPREKW